MIASINTSTIHLTTHTLSAQCSQITDMTGEKGHVVFLNTIWDVAVLYTFHVLKERKKKNMIPRKLHCSSQLPLKCSSKWCCHSNTSVCSVSCSTFFGACDVVIISDFHDMLYGYQGKWLYQECRCRYKWPVYQFRTLCNITQMWKVAIIQCDTSSKIIQ